MTISVNECPSPPKPAHGILTVISGKAYVYKSSVKVTCNKGYDLRGTAIRQCEANKKWSGSAPSCVREYDSVRIIDKSA